MRCFCCWLFVVGAVASRLNAREVLAKPKGSHLCVEGMHIQLDRRLSDRHIVNPECMGGAADFDCTEESHHFVASRAMKEGESQSGLCKDLVRSPPLFALLSDRIWDLDDGSPLEFLHGSIEVRCEANPGGTPLKVVKYSCREFLPFGTILKHDRSDLKPPSLGPGLKFEYAEFECSNPLEGSSANLLHSGPVHSLSEFASLREAREACEVDFRCRAIAADKSTAIRRFHLMDAFACGWVPRASSLNVFRANERVSLRLVAQGQILDGKDEADVSAKDLEGQVLEDWHLQNADTKSHVLVQFPDRVAHVLPEHLEKPTDSWAVLRKVRERKVICQDMTVGTSCDVYSKSQAELLIGVPTVYLCQQACLRKMQNSSYTRRCCVFSDGSCFITTGEHFSQKEVSWTSDESVEKDWAAACYQESCSMDPHCAFGKEKLMASAHTLEGFLSGTTLFFDFAHPLSLGSTSTGHNVYHFTDAQTGVEAALRDPARQVRVVGHVPTAIQSGVPAGSHTVSFRAHEPSSVKAFENVLNAKCNQFGMRIGRNLSAPNLREALASGHCDEPHGPFETCLVQAGCESAGLLPFAPPYFAQLPYDILAWQAAAPFCCGSAYTVDQRQEFMLSMLMNTAGVKEVDLAGVDDPTAKKNMLDSLHRGSSALKSMLLHHVEDDETLIWLGDMVRAALAEFKTILDDLQETVNSEGGGSDDIEISRDGESVLQVSEEGDHVAPSGRRAKRVAQWSQEKGAFIQADPDSNWAKAWAVISSVPGAVFQYGLKPLWNYVAKPLVRWGLSLMKWILEHPRAALFISKFGLLIRERMCEKVSWYVYGDPAVSAVGAFAYAAESADKMKTYLQKTFSPAVMLTQLQAVLSSSSFMDTIVDIGKFSYSLILSWTGLAGGGAAAVLLTTMASIFAEASVEAGRRAVELLVYQEIAKEVPSNLFDMLTNKCLYKRADRHKITLAETKKEILSTGKEAVAEITQSVVHSGQALTHEMGRWAGLMKSLKAHAAEGAEPLG
ncbi:unnamed protein product [Effrenium voratum]|uniref:Uncharacterized protein n=1 Tax=Effrenium voratum TaxID=2562239 RepID=A0AA36JMR2_9DINO|nr:unnamed protein product [Effrenium voratum]